MPQKSLALPGQECSTITALPAAWFASEGTRAPRDALGGRCGTARALTASRGHALRMRRGRAAHGLGAAGAAARGGTPAGLPRRPWLLALCACACLAPMRACHATAPASRGECAALASSACDDARPFPPHSGRPVRWLHVPKCGTSFANALYRYGCGQQAFDDANVRYAARRDATRRDATRREERRRRRGWPRCGCHHGGARRAVSAAGVRAPVGNS